MTGWEMYWLLMLDNIGNAISALCAGTGCIVIIGFLFGPLAADIVNVSFKKMLKWLLRLGAVVAVFVMVNAFIPTTKQMAAIIVVPKIINNEQIQELPDRLLGLGLEWLEELRPAKEADGDEL